MTTIEGLGERTFAQIREELPQGGRFVVYRYAISLAVVSLRLSSEIQYVAPGRGRVRHGLRWILITCFLGWWGIPWGPIYSVQSLVSAFRGGEDVTLEVMGALARHDQATDTSRAATPLASRTLRRASIHSDAAGSIDLVRQPDGDLWFEQRTVGSEGDGAVGTACVPAGQLMRLREALGAADGEDLVQVARRHGAALAEHGPAAWLQARGITASTLDSVA